MKQTPASFKKKNEQTKLIYNGLYSLLGLIVLAICLFVFLYVAQQRLATLGEIRHDSDTLADQLHRSSDDLTRLVRTYAITGNKKYEQQFWDVLAIRNGVKPRPLHYDRVYWDFLAVENGKAPYPLEEAVSLQELMKEAGFTEKEFSLLAEAQSNSDQLVELEQAAMNAINGKATGESGEVPNDVSGQQVAIKILFGQRYHQAKVKIMRHINMFLEELDNRTHKEYTSQASLLHILLICLISTFTLIICVVFFVMRLSKQYHTGIVSMLNSTVKDRTTELLKTNESLANEINERKKAEQALIQSAKLKSLGTITAGISHEFNNVLNVISGNAQLLQMGCKDNSEHVDCLHAIMESVDDGVNITDRMREFTHSDRDAANVDFACSDINELIIQSVKFTMPRWKTMAQVESIDYQIDTGSINGVSPILCDPIGIREVFINIINNALDAMPEGGKIAFCTRNNEGNVFISISDTGKGMTEEVRKEVFDPFFTTRRPMGTGLGLSMAYKTVMMHGGRISVESEVGKGSTFTLQFPLTTKTVDVPSKEKIPEPLTKDLSLNILVVDDEEAICKIMDSALSKQSHKVKTVNNGTEAIELSKNQYFDLVLCDLAMPKVSGYDVVKALHKLKKVPRIGIITGWGDLDFTEEDEEKIDFIIRKPFDFSILSKYINDVIGTA